MSDPEHFIARWSRRKRDAAEEAATPESAAAPDARVAPARPIDNERKPDLPAVAPGGSPGSPAAAFDPASLPPIESITAESDIRAFLAPGVPTELARAALRRAWAADPRIRDFVGLADYDWDFNTPGAIAGFGPLEMTAELRRQVEHMVGRSLAASDGDQPEPAPAPQGPPPAQTSAESVATTAGVLAREAERDHASSQDEPVKATSERHNSAALAGPGKVPVALQNDPGQSDDVQLISHRPRGRALPK